MGAYWQKLDFDKKLYRYVFIFVPNRSLQQTTRVLTGLEKSPRPILQDRVQDQDRTSQDQDQDHSSQDQDRDQDHKKSVSSALEIETELSRTTSLPFSFISIVRAPVGRERYSNARISVEAKGDLTREGC